MLNKTLPSGEKRNMQQCVSMSVNRSTCKDLDVNAVTEPKKAWGEVMEGGGLGRTLAPSG